MPCDCSYMEPTEWEKELDKVVKLLDELDGKGPPDPDEYGQGFDKRVPNIIRETGGDELVADLCSRLQKKRSLKKYSLEMQIWWRNHQKADKERIEKEIKRKRTEKTRQVAIAKLTPYERKLLGIE